MTDTYWRPFFDECRERIEAALHPWVAFLIMPLFALANAVLFKPLTAVDPDRVVRITAGTIDAFEAAYGGRTIRLFADAPIVSATLSDTGQNRFTKSVVSSGRAPITPGSSSMCAGKGCFLSAAYSCAWRGLAPSNSTVAGLARSTSGRIFSRPMSRWCGPS